MIRNRQLILAKSETTYGVDASPVPGTNAILAEVADMQIVARSLERNNVKSFFGEMSPISVGDALKIDFVTELKGSTDIGTTAPEIGVLFKGCGFDETPGTSPTRYDYTPNSTGSGSLTIYFYLDGILYKLLGCRGTFGLTAKAGEYAKIKWSFTGLFANPSDQALVSGTYSQVVPPRFISASFAIDSYSAVIENLKVDLNNEIVKRSDVSSSTGVKEYVIKDRKVTGEIDPETVLVATKDFVSMWGNNSKVALTSTIGQSANNKCIITAPAVVATDLKYADRGGISSHTMPLIFTPSAGNDEIKLSFQ